MQKFLQFHEIVLRPLFHNFKGLDGKQDFDEENLWQVYKDFNFAYLEPIQTVYETTKDMIWIHDTYLLLLPKYVRRQHINGRIGFSMHSPFPSSDIYRMFEHRK